MPAKIDPMAHYTPVPESGCWLWDGAVSTNGYGRFKVGKDRAVKYAHRMFYEAAHGAIPDGMSVCHKCDTPLCVNPAHLFLGTQPDNLADMRRKGRQVSGDRHPGAKVCADIAEKIRAMAGEMSQSAIGRLFGVSQTTVCQILSGQRWAP